MTALAKRTTHRRLARCRRDLSMSVTPLRARAKFVCEFLISFSESISMVNPL